VDLGIRHPGRKAVEHHTDGDPRATEPRLPMEDRRVAVDEEEGSATMTRIIALESGRSWPAAAGVRAGSSCFGVSRPDVGDRMPLLNELGLDGAQTDVLDEHGEDLVDASRRWRQDRLRTKTLSGHSQLLAGRPF
jgi:hypothetical protein